MLNSIQNIEEYGYWEEFDGGTLLQNENKVKDIAEPKPDYWNGIIKFRKIVESRETIDEQKYAVRKLIKSNQAFRDNFVSDDPEEIEDFITDFYKNKST